MLLRRKNNISWWGIGWIKMFFRRSKEYNTDSMSMFKYFYNNKKRG